MSEQRRLRDRVWLWGHPAGSANGRYAVAAGSQMTPVEGIHYFGGSSVYFVPWVAPMDLERTTLAADHLTEVGWSVERGRVGGHGDDRDEIDRMHELAERHPVIGRVIYDDFFGMSDGEEVVLAKPYLGYTPEHVAADRERLHTQGSRPLELWLVLYTAQQIEAAVPYIKEFDGVCLWFWKESQVADWQGRVDRFLEITEGQRRQIGVYLFNFGEDRPATAELVVSQLDRCAELVRAGTIDGFVLHTNVVADVGLEAPAAARDWMAAHGDELIA